jgi:hypothetical protein|tara:strand:+ start:1592 stop:1798 length:207 start_codon:yes stop_codon:yes gene_type:complete
MNLISRTITGGVITILGTILFIMTLFFGGIPSLIVSILIIGFGIYIFFNKKEDDIEKIKTKVKGGKKK